MRTAVIIATYEQTRELDLCLRGWGRQSVAPTWIVVADDGSGPAIAEIAARHGARHLRLDPRGDRERFGKCAAVNASVRAARDLGCDHLLFTDADCLPARTLLERHQRAALPSRFVAGGVVRLSRAVSWALTASDVETGRFESAQGGDKRIYTLPAPLGSLLDLVNPRHTPWKGGNSSCWLSDFESVNGYDERFGWGSEDKELGERLENAGVRGYSIRYSAPVFHLWHDRPYVRAEVIAQNRAILEETRRTRAAWTEAGMRR